MNERDIKNRIKMLTIGAVIIFMLTIYLFRVFIY